MCRESPQSSHERRTCLRQQKEKAWESSLATSIRICWRPPWLWVLTCNAYLQYHIGKGDGGDVYLFEILNHNYYGQFLHDAPPWWSCYSWSYYEFASKSLNPCLGSQDIPHPAFSFSFREVDKWVLGENRKVIWNPGFHTYPSCVLG